MSAAEIPHTGFGDCGCKDCWPDDEIGCSTAASRYDTGRIRRHVMSHDEADAVAAVVEAARILAETWESHGFGENHIPDAMTLYDALHRLSREPRVWPR